MLFERRKSMKRVTTFIIMTVLLLGMFATPDQTVQAAKKTVRISKKSTTLEVGESTQLSIKNASKKTKVTWSSNDKKIATVNAKGKVHAKKAGKTEITAKIKNKKYTCKVKVVKKGKKANTQTATTEQKTEATTQATVDVPKKPGTPTAPAQPETPITPEPEKPSEPENPSFSLRHTEGKNASDVAAIEKLVKEQIAAEVDSLDIDLDNTAYYKWNDGRLVGLDCEWQDAKGSISFSDFPMLQELNCHGNFNTVDVSSNTELISLECRSSGITSIDVSNNKKLQRLEVRENSLTTLDVTNNTELNYLDCEMNNISILDVSQNKKLENFYYIQWKEIAKVIGWNPVRNSEDIAAVNKIIEEQAAKGAEISWNEDSCSYEWKDGRLICINWQFYDLQGDVTFKDLPELTDLVVGGGQLANIDVSANPDLESLSCWSNKLTSLDVSHNGKLRYLDCSENQIKELDLSGNPYLEQIYCNGNLLQSLDLRGKNIVDYECDENVEVLQ